MKTYARAYYEGGFGVGCGVPRVKILEKLDKKSPFVLIGQNGEKTQDYIYKVQVTSKKAYAFTFGEIFEAAGAELWDKKGLLQGRTLFQRAKRGGEGYDNPV